MKTTLLKKHKQKEGEPKRIKRNEVAIDYPFINHPILNLQHTIGNQAVLRIAKSGILQAKFKINSPGDIYEQDADAIADKVMRMSDTDTLQTKPSPLTIHRKCGECEEEEKLQMKGESGASDGIPAPPIVHDVINRAGQPLDRGTRNFMESRFGYDFSKVRIHDDSKAAESSSDINALAYTVGNNIVFNSGQYSPHTDSGKRLLGHELTHVVQQQKTTTSIQRKPTLIESDFDEITNQVRKAIKGWGTDEEAVYRALQRLEKDSGAIEKANEVYSRKYGTTLEADIRGDFRDEELQFALELIGITPSVSDELIETAPTTNTDYDVSARKLYSAMKGWGTNEEAIFGVLVAMENVPERIDKLKTAYTDKYPTGLHGGGLEHDIRDEMSGSELDYALLLLNVFPLGNTAISTWIRGLIGSRIREETAVEVMNSLNQITDDRLTVIVVDLIRAGEISGFKSNLVSVVAGDFPALVGRIASIEAKFADSSLGTIAATPDQKRQITDILNQGMTVDVTTGDIAAFVDVVAGRSYDKDIQETLEREVTAMTPRAVGRLALPKFGWSRYEEIANEAKSRTDAVFGHYTTGSALTSAVGPGRNLFDFSENAFSDADLLHFANYLVTGHNATDPIYPGKNIHQVHTADIDRTDEKGKLSTALTTWFGIAGNRARLLQLNKSWSGAESGGNIFLQRWDFGDLNKNRRQFWKMFQTMIHEYLHKITHADYSAKAAALGRAKEQVYTEGGTSYFDERVWKTLYPEEVRANANLREKVEGGVYEYDSNLIPENSGYEQIDQFKQIVNVVGEPNASAAYFLGKTDRIGL